MTDAPNNHDPVLLRVLGVPRITSANGTTDLVGEAGRAVFSVLAASAGHWVPARSLFAAVWHTSQPRTAASSLRSHVSRVRQRLADAGSTAELAASQIDGETAYRLNVSPGEVDHIVFSTRYTEARSIAQSDPNAARAQLVEALSLWQGSAFAGVDVASLHAMARRLEDQRLDAVELDVALALEIGDHEAAINDHLETARQHPEREQLCRLLITALAAAERPSTAMELFGSTTRWLSSHLGLAPGEPLVHAVTTLFGQIADDPMAR